MAAVVQRGRQRRGVGGRHAGQAEQVEPREVEPVQGQHALVLGRRDDLRRPDRRPVAPGGERCRRRDAGRYGALAATSMPPRATPSPRSSDASSSPISPTTTALSSPLVLLVSTSLPPEMLATTGQIEPARVDDVVAHVRQCVRHRWILAREQHVVGCRALVDREPQRLSADVQRTGGKRGRRASGPCRRRGRAGDLGRDQRARVQHVDDVTGVARRHAQLGPGLVGQLRRRSTADAGCPLGQLEGEPVGRVVAAAFTAANTPVCALVPPPLPLAHAPRERAVRVSVSP